MIYYFLLIFKLLNLINAAESLSATQIFCSQIQCSTCNELSLECRNLNNPNLKQLNNCTQSIQSIIFTGNQLNIINETLFNNNEMSQLALLDLSNNQIIRFENKLIFKNVPNLFELVLDNNQLDLDTKEHYSALKMFSNSLERLSLNRAFTESKSIDFVRSAQIDMEIHSLLSLSELNNLFELRLKENALTSFNIVNKGDIGDYDYSVYFKDILCILPKLKVLHLDHNFIERIDFDMNCLNENKSSLEVLHLESNRLTTIDSDLIEKFRIFSMLNQDFRVQLLNNPFKCDCSLFNFYEWLKSDESTRIIYNKYQLKCSHDESIASTLSKSIIESNLDTECSRGQTTTTLKPRRKIYFPFRNRTFKLNNGNKEKPVYRLNSLVLFLFASITLSIIIILVLKYNCRHKIERRRMNRYTNFANDSSYTGTTVDCTRLNGDELHDNGEDVYFKQRKFANFGSYLKKVVANKRFRLDKQNEEREESISSVPYVEFDNEDKTTKNLNNKKSDLIKNQLKSADDEYSETEERTIMDAAVNNKNVKRKSSLSQSALFVRIP
jgi:hypothetical protein